MIPKTDSDIRGNFLTHPSAEVIAEIVVARLSGALRFSDKDKKRVLYFRDGRIVFAVSNSRAARLYELLLSKGRLTTADLSLVPSITNDLELGAYLLDKGFLTRAEHDQLFTDQITNIIVEVLQWNDGDWSFSHLARARDGLEFKVHTAGLLLDYARALPQDQVLKRFRSLNEKFGRSEQAMNGLVLSQNEAFVVSRADHGALTAADLANVAAMPEASALHVLYAMWLAGYLDRSDWQPAFDADSVDSMRYAKLELKREAKVMNFSGPSLPEVISQPVLEEKTPAVESQPKAPEITLSVQEYIHRIEKAVTYYDMFGVEPGADAAEIRKMYFALAKKFHPDKFHSDGPTLRKRVQNAFTEM